MANKIFVEGPEDICFINSLIDHLGIPRDRYDITAIGGWTKLPNIKNLLESNTDRGGRNILILDADNDYQERLTSIRQLLPLPEYSYELFLMPNNNDPGKLEDLIFSCLQDQHHPILNCFEQYKSCVRQINAQYVLADDKAKSFALLETLNLPTNVKERTFNNGVIWNLDCETLAPLREFLLNNLT